MHRESISSDGDKILGFGTYCSNGDFQKGNTK